jgi:hypothetical protein
MLLVAGPSLEQTPPPPHSKTNFADAVNNYAGLLIFSQFEQIIRHAVAIQIDINWLQEHESLINFVLELVHH